MRQFGFELKKLFARKRTWLGFGAFLAVEGGIVLLLNLPKPKESFRRLIEQNGYGFDQYFSGLTLAQSVLMWTTFLLGALYIALVAGDVVSKEVEEGTMRMVLCRPVTRLRLGVLKFLACAAYTFSLVAFIGMSALLLGLAYRGFGGLLVFAPLERVFALYEPWPGLARYLGALPFLALSLTSIAALGFMFSCFNMKPAAATIATLSLFLFDFIFRNIPYFESLQPYFLNTHMAAWLRVFDNYVPWAAMLEDYAYLMALNFTFVLVGLAVFHRRDFKS